MTHTKETLLAFVEKAKQAFLAKEIRSPVHLPGGNEDQLLEIFKDVKPTDYLFSGWRSMYHALLKGIPPEEVFAQIKAGRSMFLCSDKHRILCSSIVGGILPLACGVAMGIKRKGLLDRVWVFCGDMTSRTGLFHEFLAYCDGHRLPVVVVIENNGLSTNSPTIKVWGSSVEVYADNVKVIQYKYERTQPHCGVGSHVSF